MNNNINLEIFTKKIKALAMQGTKDPRERNGFSYWNNKIVLPKTSKLPQRTVSANYCTEPILEYFSLANLIDEKINADLEIYKQYDGEIELCIIWI